MNQVATSPVRSPAESEAPRETFELDGRRRAVIGRISPTIDGGRFPIKRVLGDVVEIEAEIFADGHDSLTAVLLHRLESCAEWSESPLKSTGNDVWRGRFPVTELGAYRYTALAWVDHFRSWQRHVRKKVEAQQNVTTDLLAGARMIEEAIARGAAAGSTQLAIWAEVLAGRTEASVPARLDLALSSQLSELMSLHSDRSHATVFQPELRVVVDPVLARFGAWYELFPRSLGRDGEHGKFRDVLLQLPRIAAMGFDVLYLPPIHPVGHSYRKGKNNSSLSRADEPGSPWAIGSPEGGHKSVHPRLGTLADFRELVAEARARKIEVALDIAFQCSPDHPYVKDHPEWFRRRFDGTIQYAENPPKKYQDIYPFDFESKAWETLWLELRSVFEFWIEQGVSIFRVDNPHTKPFDFWEWCIDGLKKRHPHLIFLSEAFTRPNVMNRLAKLGFTQSYNYFPWRNTKQELTDYFTELTQTDAREYLRPNLWPNTPDILTQYLQAGGRAAFIVRLVLAATLGASYGIYGPAFELCVNQAREEGSEEYLDSEKYEIRCWDIDSPGNLTELIKRVNRIRRTHPALHRNEGLQFHSIDNEQILAYSKSTVDGNDHLLMVVNLDPHHVQRGWLDLSAGFDIPGKGSYQMHDLLTDARYLWHGGRNFVELDPDFSPAHIFRLRQRVRTERDFDYYL